MDGQTAEQPVEEASEDVRDALRVLDRQKAELDRLRAAFFAGQPIDFAEPG